MKARVKATGEIVEVELANTYRFNDGSFVEVFRDLNADTLYFGRDLDFDIEGKFAENCLNGIKQGIAHHLDYWIRLEHQYAGMAMQGLMSYIEQVTPTEGSSYCDTIVDFSFKIAHFIVKLLQHALENMLMLLKEVK